MFEKRYQDLEGLPSKAKWFASVSAQLAGPEIQLEVLEPCEARRPVEGWHTYLRRGEILTLRSDRWQAGRSQIGENMGDRSVLRRIRASSVTHS